MRTVVGTLPAVVSVTPANGAKGITADASIVVTFSEPMNQASTEAAYQSGDLPAGGVAFSWNQDSTVMTVKLTSPLTYAQGSTFTQAAKSYAFSLTGNATDKAGNRLPLPTRPSAPCATSWRSYQPEHRGQPAGEHLQLHDYAVHPGR